MIFDIFLSLLSTILEYFFRAISYTSKRITPLRLNPTKITDTNDTDWESILTLEMRNTLDVDLYDINIVGVSKSNFNIEIIKDNQPNERSVKKMNLNTNSIVLYVEDVETKNKGWIYRLHNIKGKDRLLIKFKLRNTSPVHFKILHYSFNEVIIKERSDGAIAIPFVSRKLPKI